MIAALRFLALLALLLIPVRVVAASPAPKAETYCDGTLALEIYRFAHGSRRWRWPLTGAPRGAAIRIGLATKDSPWLPDYRPLLLATAHGGDPASWIEVSRKLAPEGPLDAVQDYQTPVPGVVPPPTTTGNHALYGVFYGRLQRIRIPDALLFRIRQGDPRLGKELAYRPLPSPRYGIWVHRNLTAPPSPKLRSFLETMGNEPHGSRVLQALGASWLRAPKGPPSP
jgi:hypothetical protein